MFCLVLLILCGGGAGTKLCKKYGGIMGSLNYNDIRLQIKNGDVLLYQGSGLISWLIKKVTGSKYSHAGIVVWWHNRLMVLEAVGKGIICTPLSRNIGHYQGEVHLYTAREMYQKGDPWTERGKRQSIVEFAQMELGKEYATWKLVLYGWKLLWGRDLDKKDKFRTSNKLVCSQYVAAAYNIVGVDLKEGLADRFTKPSDIAKSKKLEMVGAIK